MKLGVVIVQTVAKYEISRRFWQNPAVPGRECDEQCLAGALYVRQIPLIG
jgi:hypothetical protein